MKGDSVPMRVLQIANTDFFFRYLLLDKLIALRKAGMEVHLLSPPGKYRSELEEMGFTVTYIPFSREINIVRDVRSIISLVKYMKEKRFHIVHTHTGKGGFVGRFSAWIAGIPIILHTIHGFSFYKGQSWITFRLAKLAERVCGWISDRIFFQNREDFQEVRRTKLLNPRKIRYIGNGINIDYILEEADSGRKRNVKSELQLDKDTPLIGFFARLEPIKRHSFFLHAFTSVVRKIPNAVCLIAGEGPLHDRLRELTQHLSIERNVRFLGFRDDAKQLISACDIIVLPSFREGVPRILLEAMVNEKPVVATDVRGNREVVDNYRNGILIHPYDADSLSRVLSDLLKDGIMREKMGKEGKKKILREFDERRVIGRLLREYDRAADECLEKMLETT